MRRLPYQVVLYVVATLAFASVAMAQQQGPLDSPGRCSLVAEQLGANPDSFSYDPGVDGCFVNEGSPVGVNNNPVFDAQTGEELGLFKDLVDFHVSHGSFCRALEGYTLGAQQYFEQTANAQEQAVLDPDGDGQACTAEDAAAQQGEDTCVGISFAEFPSFIPDAGGCALLEGTPGGLVDLLNAPVLDPDTREQIGIVKDLDPDLSSGANSTTYQEFCGAFPTPDFYSPAVTAQQYFEGEGPGPVFSGANAKEQAILDPNGDGQACTAEDEAFLAGDTGADGAAADDGATSG